MSPRRSARVKALDSAPVYTDPPASGNAAGTKRKGDATTGSSPNAKRGKKSGNKKKQGKKEQKTIDETMDVDEKNEDDEDVEEDGVTDAQLLEAESKDVDTEMEDQPPKPAEEAQEAKQGATDATGDAKKAESEDKPTEEPAPADGGNKTEAAQADGDKTEPGQSTIDQFVEKKDESAPAKPSEGEPQASGALPVSDGAPKAEESSGPAAEGTSAAQSNDQPRQDDSVKPSSDQNATNEQPNGHHAPATNDDKPAEEKHEEKPAETQHETKSADTQHTDKPAETQHASEAAPSSQPPATKTTNGDAVEANERDGDMPSSILEKGIVYFFFRARVNVNEPQDVNDIARSYMILRPLPKGAALSSGPIGDDSNCRLIAIPKKVLPLTGKDRFMAFVESTKQSFKDLKSFLSSSDYATKTVGTSHSPAATPIAEGVYAITTTGKDSHFAYMTTLPSSLGEVQKDVGIKEQGSFAISAKNPKFPGPANAQLQKQPEYPSNIQEEFRDLRWAPLKPEMLDHENAQFLIIGESQGLDTALETLPRDEKKGLDEPREEMERLEGEDEVRVRDLKGNDAVFADLGISKSSYPSLLTSWDS